MLLHTTTYKGFTITARTYQIRGTGRWSLDVLIGRHTRIRAFGNTATFDSERDAIAGCCDFGKLVIDGKVEHCSIRDLRTD